MDFTNYFGRLSCKGKTARERMIFDVHRDMMMKAETNPSYKTVDVDGEELHVLITSTQTVTAKNVVAMPGENFETGSIMIYNGSHWLITQRDLEDDVNIRGKIELCQREVIWQNQETGEIHRRWATVEKPYYSNITENNVISMSTREFKIQMPYDEETNKLYIDKRLMLEIVNGEPKTYKITSIDSMTTRYDRNGEIKGFLVINTEQDQYDPSTDNKELMVCDYVDPDSIIDGDPEEQEGLQIEFLGKPQIRIGGYNKKFTAHLNGEITPAVWSIKSKLSGVTMSISEDQTSCKLGIEDDISLYGEKFILSAFVEVSAIESYSAEIEIEVSKI